MDDADQESGEEQRAFALARQADQSPEDGPAPSKKPRLRWRRKRTSVPMDTDQDREVARAIVKLRRLEQTITLRFMLAVFAIVAVSVQLLAANLLFWGYLSTPEWRFATPQAVVVAWLSASVVQVIGIVLVIARNLFPSNVGGIDKRQTKRIIDALDNPRGSKR